MDQHLEIQLPEIWGDSTFEEDQWGDLNYLIGPNGTGKSLFAEELQTQLERESYSVRYLSADRLSGIVGSSNDYQYARSQITDGFNLQQEGQYRSSAQSSGYSSDAYLLLRDKPDLRVRVQAVLSEYFDRDINLKVEGGFLIPVMVDNSTSTEYDLHEHESHGLKELISILTIIHNDDPDVIVIDEPELHLHPQYQKYLLNEIQKLSGPPNTSRSKTFFLVTHSPTMLEFQTLPDMKNIYSFRDRHELPLSVPEPPDDADSFQIRRLIPRLNTQHKEALFSRRPLLVEGYTDKQIFSLIIDNHDTLQTDPGSNIVSLDGKDNIDSYFLFCQKLGLNPRILADLDVLFSGGLKQTLSDISAVNSALRDIGHSDLLSAVGSVLSQLSDFINELQDLDELEGPLLQATEDIHSGMDSSTKQYIMYRAIRRDLDYSRSIFESADLDTMIGTMDSVLDVLDEFGYHILRQGELEDYLTSDDIPLSGANSTRKSSLFDETRSELMEAQNSDDVDDMVPELVEVLSDVLSTRDLSILSHMESTVSLWIHDVQSAVIDGEITSLSDLETHYSVGEERYDRLFEVTDFSYNNGGFQCSIRIQSSLDPNQTVLSFDDDTVPSKISL